MKTTLRLNMTIVATFGTSASCRGLFRKGEVPGEVGGGFLIGWRFEKHFIFDFFLEAKNERLLNNNLQFWGPQVAFSGDLTVP